MAMLGVFLFGGAILALILGAALPLATYWWGWTGLLITLILTVLPVKVVLWALSFDIGDKKTRRAFLLTILLGLAVVPALFAIGIIPAWALWLSPLGWIAALQCAHWLHYSPISLSGLVHYFVRSLSRNKMSTVLVLIILILAALLYYYVFVN
jgi:hypothetical protein